MFTHCNLKRFYHRLTLIIIVGDFSNLCYTLAMRQFSSLLMNKNAFIYEKTRKIMSITTNCAIHNIHLLYILLGAIAQPIRHVSKTASYACLQNFQKCQI